MQSLLKILLCIEVAALIANVSAFAQDELPAEEPTLGPVEPDPLAFFRGWNFEGSNTARFDQYDQKGPDGPYFEEGAQYYDEIDIGLHKRDGLYSTWRSQLSLFLGDNDYRSIDRGVVPERINITREVGDRQLGDRTIPYRWELGDYFSYTSYMTQQLSGKGLQTEMQPGFFGQADSIVIFGGTNETRWQELTFDEDASAGASYLNRSEVVGEVSLNAIYNFREGNDDLGTRDRDQGVISTTYLRDFVLFEQKLVVQAEQAFFVGDHDGFGDTSNRFGVGTFAEVRGQHPTLPLDYRIRGERYDEDFRPRGAVVTADRQSGELHAGWRFDNGLRLRGRFQGYEDSFEQSNELRTTLGGLNLSGPMFSEWIPDVSGTVDFLGRQVKNDDETIDTDTFNLRADFGKPICEDWYGRFGFFGEIADDRSGAGGDLDTWQLSFSTDYALDLGSITGLITPGVVVRFLRAGSGAAFADSDEFDPTLAMRLKKDEHSLGFNYGSLVQNRTESGTTDFVRHTLSGDYRFERGPHSVGAEINYFGFRKQSLEDTDAWRVGVFWTFRFDSEMLRSTTTTPAEVPVPYSNEVEEVDLANLLPGVGIVSARNRLAWLGVTGGARYGDYDVYDYQVFPRVNQLQRLVLVRSNDKVATSGVVISFDRTFTGDTAAQAFERVRKALIDRYGKPVRFREEGEFSDDFVADVNAARLIRTSEWETSAGVIRFGIPRRLDGQVRMEVQHRSSFGSPRDTLWSLEGVR